MIIKRIYCMFGWLFGRKKEKQNIKLLDDLNRSLVNDKMTIGGQLYFIVAYDFSVLVLKHGFLDNKDLRVMKISELINSEEKILFISLEEREQKSIIKAAIESNVLPTNEEIIEENMTNYVILPSLPESKEEISVVLSQTEENTIEEIKEENTIEEKNSIQMIEQDDFYKKIWSCWYESLRNIDHNDNISKYCRKLFYLDHLPPNTPYYYQFNSFNGIYKDISQNRIEIMKNIIYLADFNAKYLDKPFMTFVTSLTSHTMMQYIDNKRKTQVVNNFIQALYLMLWFLKDKEFDNMEDYWIYIFIKFQNNPLYKDLWNDFSNENISLEKRWIRIDFGIFLDQYMSSGKFNSTFEFILAFKYTGFDNGILSKMIIDKLHRMNPKDIQYLENIRCYRRLS